MGLKDIDLGAALGRLADRKIEQAMREGKFDRIEGAGRPLDLEPIPAEENARLRWWALRILKQNDVLPDEVLWRKRLDTLRDELDAADSEPHVAKLVLEYNRLVRQINTLGTNAINLAVSPLALADELGKMRGRWSARRIATELLAPVEAAGPEEAGKPAEKPPSPPVRPPEPARPKGGLIASLVGLPLKTCGRSTCRSRNPGKAKFCRCCGRPL